MASGRPSKKPKYFTPSSEGYTFLASSFKEFVRSEGNSGIDPFITTKQDIDAIYEKFSVFRDYSKSTFPQRFRSLADKFKLSKYKERKRAESPSECLIVFYFTLLFSHIQKLLSTKPIKKKGSSFPSKTLQLLVATTRKKRKGPTTVFLLLLLYRLQTLPYLQLPT